MSSGESLRFQWKTVQSFNNHSGYSIFQFENNVNFVKRDNNFTSLFGSTRKIGLNVKWVVFSSTTGRSFLFVTETFPTGDKFVSSNSSYSSGKVVQLSKRWKVLFTREFLMDWDRSLQGRFETLWWKYLRNPRKLEFRTWSGTWSGHVPWNRGKSMCHSRQTYSKRFTSRYCAQVGARAKKNGRRERGGGFLFSPLPPGTLLFSCSLVPTFSTNSRGNACYAGWAMICFLWPRNTLFNLFSVFQFPFVISLIFSCFLSGLDD